MTEKERRAKIESLFPEPYQTSDDYKNIVKSLIDPMMSLLPKDRKDDRAFLGSDPKLTIDFVNVHKAVLSEEGMSEKEVFSEVVNMFQGAPNWGSSLAMMNVIPQSNKAGLASFLFSAIFSPNILEGEYAWNVHKAELESGAMLGDMAWDDGSKSGCIFTYGGEAGWTYALQYGKTRVLKGSMQKGIFGTPCKVICSKVAQFSKQHSAVWSGIGTDNLIQIPIDDANRMDLVELEKVLKDLHEKDIPVACIIATEGTTDTNSFDSVKGIHDLMEKYPNNPAKYGKAVIYADAVIGFSWLAFKGYDFDKNPLGFSKEALPIIKEEYDRASEIKYADCYSTDFHKSGYCPYVATSFNYRDAKEFETLMSYEATVATDAEHQDKYAYLQERSPYNPMNYTLESSRAATGSVSAWATLKYFGKNGFRLVNGWEVEHHLWIRQLVEKHSDMVVVNPKNHGQVTLLRVYNSSVKDAKAEYDKELNDPNYKSNLIKNNNLIRDVGNILWDWFRSGKKIDGRYTPYMSFSTGFKPTNYNTHWEDKDAVIFALKIYPMPFHATDETFDWVVKCIQMAVEEVEKNKTK